MLYIVVQFAAWYFAVKDSQNKSIGGRKTNGATAKGRAAAINHIDALLDHSLLGVSLGWSEQVQLRKLLGQLRSEIVKIDRKPRGGKGSEEREIMERMVAHMLLFLDASSPVIVENFAAMAGWECDSRTVQRYVDAGKELHEELMSKRRPKD